MTVDLPISRVTNASRSLGAAATVTRSPFTGSRQVQDWGGSWWQYQIEFSTIADAEGRRLSAFLSALRGPVGSFIFRDPFIKNAVGLGSPVVNGAGQTGNTLVTSGWTGTGLVAGDFFSLGSGSALRLYQVTADAPPSGGAATLQIIPALRSSPASGAPLNVVNPGVLLCVDGPIPTQIGLADFYQFSISAREAI